jgi:hypothetical protein
VHLTRGYHALAHDFSLRVGDDALGTYLAWVLDGFEERDPAVEYLVRPGSSEEHRYEVVLDGEVVLHAATATGLVDSIVHHVNLKAIDAEYAVMSHAGGVERDGAACVFPAHMESGKTTLTAGLVRAGFAYLTDEAVAFGWESGEIEPYPKPLSIDAGSQLLFPELAPPPPPGDDAVARAQWQVPPDSIRPGAVGARCRARYVVFPEYVSGADTALEPMSRAAGLVELARNTFEFRSHSRRALDALAGIVRTVDCFHLVVGDLDAACALVADLLDVSAPSRGSTHG